MIHTKKGGAALWLLAAVILVAAGGGYYYYFIKKSESPPAAKSEETQAMGGFEFATPKKSAHYENNTPLHGAILAGMPLNIVVDVNFDLAKPSSISVMNGGKEYGAGETMIDANKLAMRRKMEQNAPDGLYSVSYNACWPDGSCHDGNFQFAIDREASAKYEDMRGKEEITIRLSEVKFTPMNIRVSKNTKIMWINDDTVTHYVNTNPHPQHTYYPPQNSPALQKGDGFMRTFREAGIYNYHCSAHADSMKGSILVE
ncbi:MAG: hypothetical protein G01um101433_5 [Parcubacteria group bacterium Gr01-1014_33]|nr:MAG: hypothetical protein G01um101433_5 [Parcubacteria group bacterium Gr01-1014_33]